MSLNLASLVSQAFGIAKALAPDALPTCTVRIGPTTTANPVDDTATTGWSLETTANPIQYSDKNEREQATIETNQKSFCFPGSTFPPGTVVDQKGEIEQGDTTWQIYRVEQDPTGSVWIFHCNR